MKSFIGLCSLLFLLSAANARSAQEERYFVVLDGSSNLGKSDFNAVKLLLRDALSYGVGDKKALVTFLAGNDASIVETSLEDTLRSHVIESTPHPAEQDFEPSKTIDGIVEFLAETNSTSQSMIVIATDAPIVCERVSYCRKLTALKARGTILSTLRFSFTDTGPLPEMDLASVGFNFTVNSAILGEFKEAVEKARERWGRPQLTKSSDIVLPGSFQILHSVESNSAIVHGGDRLCPLSPSGMSLDILLVLDSSPTIGRTSFESLKMTLKDLLSELTFGIGESDSRLALIAVSGKAELTHSFQETQSTSEAMKALEDLPYSAHTGKSDFLGALKLANQAIGSGTGSRPSVVFFVTDQEVDCRPDHEQNPCRAAAVLRSKATVGTLALRYPDVPAPDLRAIATPCDALTLSENIGRQFREVLVRSSCTCGFDQYKQFFADAEGCQPTTTCLRVHTVRATASTAIETCELNHGTLVTIKTPEKEKFVEGEIKNAISPEMYYIGLKIIGQVGSANLPYGSWSNGDGWSVTDFNRFETFPSAGSCVAIRGDHWEPVPCSDPLALHFYVCERLAQ